MKKIIVYFLVGTFLISQENTDTIEESSSSDTNSQSEIEEVEVKIEEKFTDTNGNGKYDEGEEIEVKIKEVEVEIEEVEIKIEDGCLDMYKAEVEIEEVEADKDSEVCESKNECELGTVHLAVLINNLHFSIIYFLLFLSCKDWQNVY